MRSDQTWPQNVQADAEGGGPKLDYSAPSEERKAPHESHIEPSTVDSFRAQPVVTQGPTLSVIESMPPTPPTVSEPDKEPKPAENGPPTAKVRTTDEDLKTFINRLMDLLILPSGTMPPQERTLVDDLVTHAINFVPKEHQIKVVERLIAHHATPRTLLRHLLHSEADLSIPILCSSLTLSDSDLISVITQKDEEHRKVIAQRDGIPSSVSDALIRFSDSATLRVLLRNEWARLSRQAFVMLAERSIEEEGIREPLIERADLPTDLAHLIFWWCDHSLRRRIIDRFTCQRQSILEPMPKEIFASLRNEKGEIARAVRMLKRNHSTDQEMISQALQALDQNQGNECLDLISRAAEITPESAAQILDDEGGEPIAVLAKACGFGRENFFRLRRIMTDRQGRQWHGEAAHTDHVTVVYDTLSTDRADVILRYWDRTSREVYEDPSNPDTAKPADHVNQA